jgi:hypothetical protein
MEENKKTIWIVLGLGVVGLYLFMKNKKPSVKSNKLPVTPKQDILPSPTSDGTINTYPVGLVLSSNQTGNVNTGVRVQLKEGNAIKGIPETVYILKDGQKHPVTEKWWFYNYGEDWSDVIQLSNTTVDMIPTGSVFTINGQ